MAANRIRGITVEINVNTTGLSKVKRRTLLHKWKPGFK